MVDVKKKTTGGKSVVKTSSLSASVFDLNGKSTGKMTLSKEIFGGVVNKKLLAQAVRIYLANKRQGNASTKTRSEVDGSSRKIYKQKGTGRARHGTLRAPIFVKGGVAHGPKPRDFSLDFPKKMRKKALFSALSAKFSDEEIVFVSGFEKISPKTKQFSELLKKLSLDDKKKNFLIVRPDGFENARRAIGNIEGVSEISAVRLNALDVLRARKIIFAKESISDLERTFLKKEEK